jgi:glyoxylase-like metal-dependent hydrolase (beta-lactamase superfamily II)
MVRERVSDDVYVFTSDLYAQVTAGLVVSPEGAAVIDTLAFPSETKEIVDLVHRLNVPVKYVINTHYHADHTYGTSLFKGAEVVSHRKCRDLLDTVGRKGLKEARVDNSNLEHVEVILPDLIFAKGQIELHLGKKTLTLTHSPGHSPDSITVLVKEDRILFAGDTMMPLPYFVDGSLDDIYQSIQAIPPLGLENIVQGHGEVILRGEIDDAVRSNLRYLDNIKRKVERHIERNRDRDELLDIDIESCGKSRIPLSGLVVRLHQQNLLSLYDQYSKTKPAKKKAAPKKPALKVKVAKAPKAKPAKKAKKK